MKPPVSTAASPAFHVRVRAADSERDLIEAPSYDSDAVRLSAPAETSNGNGESSLSTRDLVIRLFYEERLPFPEIAHRLDVTRAWVYEIAQQERLRRDKGSAPLGCLVCGKIPKLPGRLRSNGMCAKHAYRLARYGDPEAEIAADKPSTCDSCGQQCGRRGQSPGANGNGVSRSGRIFGADGKYRCQRCAWREDEGFRGRHRKTARAWQVRARGLRILRDAKDALRECWETRRLPRKEFDSAREVLDTAIRGLQGRE